MKKFLALLLAAMMLFSLTAALAEGEGADNTIPGSFTKRYVNAIPAGSTLTFKAEYVADLSSNSTDPQLLGATGEFTHTVTADSSLINTVNFTALKPTEYGAYVYKITEKSDSNANVTLDTEALYIVVKYYVDTTGAAPTDVYAIALINGETNEPAPILEGDDRAEDVAPPEQPDGKKDQFVNTYATSSVDVTKNIAGNAADYTKMFDVTITLDSPYILEGANMKWGEETVTIERDDTYTGEGYRYTVTAPATKVGGSTTSTTTLSGIPVGVTVTVTEADYASEGYETKYDGNGATVAKDATSTITITNTKENDLPTGVVMDYIPYIILLVVAAAGLASFVLKRRMAADNDD